MLKLDEGVKFSVNVMVNRERNKVLFAEADSDFVEALLSFLALPLGDIMKKFEQHYESKAPIVGSLFTLYKGVINQNDGCFCTDGGKQMLLNPTSSYYNEPIKCFRCVEVNCTRKRGATGSMYYGTRRCDCGALLSRPMGDIELKTQAHESGMFAEKHKYFLVTDDLQIAPIEQGFVIKTLINLGITVTQGAEFMNATLGYNEIMLLLKGSFLSNTPLTDTILNESITDFRGEGDVLNKMVKEPLTPSKKMIVEAVVNRSTNMLVYVLASEDFIDFLFSFLTIPLSGVECLLGGKTGLQNIDNLYESVASIDEKYLVSPDTKNRLTKPDLPPNYLSKYQIFPLSEQMTPSVYYMESRQDSENRTVEKGSWMCFKDPKGDEGSYVKQQGKFVVLDDLTVTPFTGVSPETNPNRVKVLELQIGLKEGLNILKASLGSSSALTDGLIKPFLKNQM